MARVHVELRVDSPQMRAHRVLGNDERVGDPVGRGALGEQINDLYFAEREAEALLEKLAALLPRGDLVDRRGHGCPHRNGHAHGRAFGAFDGRAGAFAWRERRRQRSHGGEQDGLDIAVGKQKAPTAMRTVGAA